MARKADETRLHELLYQALETEAGGIEIYRTAISCAVNDDLKEEWQGYLDETKTPPLSLIHISEPPSPLSTSHAGLSPYKKLPPHRSTHLPISPSSIQDTSLCDVHAPSLRSH